MSITSDHISIKPPSTGKLVYSIIGIAAVAVLVASQLQYSKKEYVSGFLQGTGGDLRIVAPNRGIVNFTAKAGSSLDENDSIAVIKSAETLISGKSLFETQKTTLADKKQSLTLELESSANSLQARAQALLAQKTIALASVEQAKTEANTRRQFVQLEEKRLQRQIELQKQGFVSAVAIEQAQSDLLARKADFQAVERSIIQAQAQVSALDADIAANQSQMQSQRQQLQRELSNVDQASIDAQKMDSIKVTTPKASTVLTLAAADGDAVEAGQLLAKLTPKNTVLEALLLLPPSAAGRVQPEQKVSLQLAAYPYQTYGLVQAEIVQVESTPVFADETTLRTNGVPAGTMVIKAVAKITQVPSGIDPKAFQSGMQFRAAVEVERKSFLSWMTWPLLKHFL